jgi:hypothetical protein
MTRGLLDRRKDVLSDSLTQDVYCVLQKLDLFGVLVALVIKNLLALDKIILLRVSLFSFSHDLSQVTLACFVRDHFVESAENLALFLNVSPMLLYLLLEFIDLRHSLHIEIL